MRKANWRTELNKYIEDCHRREFSYGLIDCCTFCADAVVVMTGVDYMKEFRGQYKTKDEAVDALRVFGDGSLLNTMKEKLGPVLKRGHVGDVAFMWGDDGPTLGICLGADSVFIGEEVDGSLVKVTSSGLRFFEVK